MALDDVLKAIEKSNNIEGIVRTLASDSLNPQAIEGFAEYAKKYKGIAAERIPPLIEGWEKEPGILRQSAEEELQQAKAEKLKAIEEKYPEVIKALDQKAQELLALTLPNKNKKYEAIQGYLHQAENEKSEQNYDAIRKALAELYPNVALWQIYFQQANPALVKEYAKFYVGVEQKRFQQETIEKETEKDGKKKYSPDKNKRIDYILKTIEGIKEKDRVPIYDLIGNLYAQQIAQKKASKKQ